MQIKITQNRQLIKTNDMHREPGGKDQKTTPAPTLNDKRTSKACSGVTTRSPSFFRAVFLVAPNAEVSRSVITTNVPNACIFASYTTGKPAPVTQLVLQVQKGAGA